MLFIFKKKSWQMQEDHLTKVLRNNKISYVAMLQCSGSAQRTDTSAKKEPGREKEPLRPSLHSRTFLFL